MNRYLKNELVDFVGINGVKAIQNAKILILGAGAVGTNLIVNLASMGVKYIGLVDDDIIEEQNLSIQTLYTKKDIGKYKVEIAKKWINKYNPQITLNIYNTRLDENNYESIFKDYEILVDAFDTQKSVLLENKLAIKTKKPIIFTGTKNMESYVLTTIPNVTPCYNCFIEHNKEEEEKPYGVFQSTGAIAAGLQTQEIIKLILKKGKIIHTSPLVFDGFNGRFFRLKIYKSTSQFCEVCGLPKISYNEFKE